MRIQFVEKITPPFLINSIGSLSVLSSRVHCCTRYCAKNLAEPPWVRVPTRVRCFPRPLQGCAGIADQQLSSCSSFKGDRVGACTLRRCAARDICGRALPCVLLPHIVSTNDQPRLLTSCRLSHLSSSNSAPACTGRRHRGCSRRREGAPLPPRSMPALPRVSPPTPTSRTASSLARYLGFATRCAGGTPRPPASDSTTKAPRHAVASRSRASSRTTSRAIARYI